MKEALREMRRELTVFWIINRHRDSIELLHSFQEVFTDVPIHVCRNLYFGEARRFDMYNSSKAREAVEKNGMTVDHPDIQPFAELAVKAHLPYAQSIGMEDLLNRINKELGR